MALGLYNGFYLSKPHPDPSQPNVQLPLLDTSWVPGQPMPVSVNAYFNDIPTWTVTRYMASDVRRIPNNFRLRSYSTTDTEQIIGTLTLSVAGDETTIISQRTSDEWRFGNFNFQDAPNKLVNTTNDIFSFEVPTPNNAKILNGLDPTFLKDMTGATSNVYKKSGLAVRDWGYQEATDIGVWVLLNIYPIWSIGPLYPLGCTLWHSLFPNPPNLGPGAINYTIGTAWPNLYQLPTAQYGIPAGTLLGFLTKGVYSISYNGSSYVPYDGLDQPAGTGEYNYTKLYRGPGYFVPNPKLYDIVNITTIEGLPYGSGTMTWNTKWQLVPPEFAPFVVISCTPM